MQFLEYYLLSLLVSVGVPGRNAASTSDVAPIEMSDNATFEVHNLTKFSIQVSRNTSNLTVDSFDHNSHLTSRSSLSCREVTMWLDDASQAFEVKLPKLIKRSAIKWRQVKMPLISGLEAPIKLFYMAVRFHLRFSGIPYTERTLSSRALERRRS